MREKQQTTLLYRDPNKKQDFIFMVCFKTMFLVASIFLFASLEVFLPLKFSGFSAKLLFIIIFLNFFVETLKLTKLF